MPSGSDYYENRWSTLTDSIVPPTGAVLAGGTPPSPHSRRWPGCPSKPKRNMISFFDISSRSSPRVWAFWHHTRPSSHLISSQSVSPSVSQSVTGLIEPLLRASPLCSGSLFPRILDTRRRTASQPDTRWRHRDTLSRSHSSLCVHEDSLHRARLPVISIVARALSPPDQAHSRLCNHDDQLPPPSSLFPSDLVRRNTSSLVPRLPTPRNTTIIASRTLSYS